MSLKIKNKKNTFNPDTLLSCIYNHYVYESFNKMNEKSKCNEKPKYVKKLKFRKLFC